MLLLLPLLIAALQQPAPAQVRLDEAPSDLRLYPRGEDGFGRVEVRGEVLAGGWEEVALELIGEDGHALAARFALAPASATRRAASTLSQNGEAPTISGLLSFRPR